MGNTEDVMDMRKFMLAAEVGTLPVFVTQNLSNLTPLSVNNFDMRRILCEFERNNFVSES